MRLIGYWFGEGEGPIEGGWLPLGDLSVVMGANDAGKSRLLRRFAADLEAMAAPSDASAPPTALLFVELERSEFDHVLSATYWDQNLEPIDDNWRGERAADRPFWRALRGELDGVKLWIDDLRERFAGKRHSRTVLRLLKDSRILAIRPLSEPSVGAEGARLGLYWCAPAVENLSAAEATAIEAFTADAGARDVAIGPAAPTPVVAVGEFDGPLIPSPASLPGGEARLQEDAAEAVSQLLRAKWVVLKAAADDEFRAAVARDGALRYLDALPGLQDAWLESADRYSAHLSTDACQAFELMTEAARKACAQFLASRYDLRIEPAPLREWAQGSPVRITLRLRPIHGTPGDSAPTETSCFSLGQVADGLKLWAEFAVAEGIDAVRMRTLDLLKALPSVEGSDPDGEDLVSCVAWAQRWLSTRGSHRVEGAPRARPSFGERLEWWDGESWGYGTHSVTPHALRLGRPTLYLIDEPERHLNPRLVREAARWLEDWLAGHRAQAIVVSHAVAFLGAGERTRYVLAERGAERASLRAFSPDELTAMTDIAQSLGLDHGELLGMTKLLLFVEGQGDRAVLEALFGSRLRRAGIVVVPISGTKNHPVIVEGDVLLRYCAHRAAVVFDKLNAACVGRLRRDRAFRREVYGKASTECKNMVQLLDAADRVERVLTPLPLEAPDMFDLLDDEVLRELFPSWPGHAEAQLAYGLERPRDKSYWKHLRDGYGAGKEVATLAAAAVRMRELGRVPTVLEALVEQAERLAEDADAA